jgi:type II secretory pathway component GspD/PulD (secretin)
VNAWIKKGLGASCLLVLSAGLCAATADEPAPAKSKRLLYVVKHGQARPLAELLNKHFKGEIEVEAPEASNCLLIRTSPAALGDIVKLLGQIDRRPRTVAVEVMLAERAAAKEAKAELVAKGLTGPVAEVEARLKELQRKGEITGLKRFRLTALEHQQASVMVGESKPFVAGMTVTPTGRVARTVFYRSLGTSLKLTLRVAPENKVMLDVDLQESQAIESEDGIVVGKDENGKLVRRPDFTQDSLKTTLSIPSGHAVFGTGVTTEKGRPRTLVIVSARIVDADGGKE